MLSPVWQAVFGLAKGMRYVTTKSKALLRESRRNKELSNLKTVREVGRGTGRDETHSKGGLGSGASPSLVRNLDLSCIVVRRPMRLVGLPPPYRSASIF